MVQETPSQSLAKEENTVKATGRATRFPDALAFLFIFMVLAAICTYILPAGSYKRDANDPRHPVIPGTYERANHQSPASAFSVLASVQKGMIKAAPIIFFVLFIGGALGIIERTGALGYGIETIVAKFQNSPLLIIPIGVLVFTICGATFGMFEEIIIFVPILIKLMGRLKFDALTALSICCIAAIVGGVFGPFNPFNVAIAQGIASLSIYSGFVFRSIVCVAATIIVIHHTMRHAKSIHASNIREKNITKVLMFDIQKGSEKQSTRARVRHIAVLVVLFLSFILLITGTTQYSWGPDEMATLFLVMGGLAGLIGGLGVNGTVYAFVRGVRGIVYGPLLIGLAQATSIILEEGNVIDTIVAVAADKLAHLPSIATVLGMFVFHSLLHVPVPSYSGHAVLTLPILVPLSDLLNIPRQVTVLAYQYGSGLFTLITPTEGTLLAVIAIAGVQYRKWVRFTLPLIVKLGILAITALIIAQLIHLE
jgi:uncharacterized ion transporter superfamily protein YfcC